MITSGRDVVAKVFWSMWDDVEDFSVGGGFSLIFGGTDDGDIVECMQLKVP